jgi:hypothetical protein
MDAEYELQPRSERKRLLPWLGLALLATSWLPGLGYFHSASPFTWATLVAAGTLLLAGVRTLGACPITTAIAAVLAVPMIWIAPHPYNFAPILIVVGAIATALCPPRRWAAALAAGTLSAGLVLLAQSVGLLAYEAVTSRTHELPMPLARLVGGIAKAIGIDATVSPSTIAGGYGADIVLRTMRKAHHLGATWELLVDPISWSLIVGAAVLLALTARWRALAILAACALAWLPVRAGLLMSLVMHRALRTDFDTPLRVMDAFQSTWVLLALLAVFALLASRFIALPGTIVASESDPADAVGRAHPTWRLLRPALFALAVAAITVAATYDPVGIRKSGKIVVDEFHSKWEPATRPYDEKWYGHESGYNYAAIYDYSSRYYDMARLIGPGMLDRSAPRNWVKVPAEVTSAAATTRPAIDDAVLAGCDVLVLKCLTQRLTIDEVERIKKFVADGGGLLLVGEHTDVFGIGTNLNDVARQFGFQFRYDILFGIDEDKPFDYKYVKPLVPHPIVQRMPPLDFEGPCTIEPFGPPGSGGRAVMTAIGQRGEIAHYHASNFMPPPEDRADARYGAWTLLWATKYGKGRVVAHADSTQWSNFSAFEPGKPEVWIGMLEWLNHRNGGIADPRLPYLIFAAVLLVAIPVIGKVLPQTALPAGGALVTICAGACAFALSALAVRAIHSGSMPAPPRKPDRPIVAVGIDRTVSDAILSKGGFIGGKPEGFAIFERWILRLGWFIRRGEAGELLDPRSNDLVVFFAPSKDVSDDTRRQLVQYVNNGGHVLIFDSPEIPRSTANSLLKPFGMELRRPYGAEIAGDATWARSGIKVPVAPCYEVVGGDRTLATVANKPVAATARFGKGTVTAIGCGARFNDSNFGVTGDVVPAEDLQKLYDLQFALLKSIVENK